MSDAATEPGAGEPALDVTGASSYDLLRDRLADVAQRLATAAGSLNARRAEAFASVALAVAEQDRVRTDAACVPRDAVCVGDLLLLGCNVPSGLSTARAVGDVLTLYRLVRRSASDWDVNALSPEDPAWFLGDAEFQRDFTEIYRYYADARLESLAIVGEEIRMVFGIGSALEDTRTLRWRLRPGERPAYSGSSTADGRTDDRYDFAWQPIGREALRGGRWPTSQCSTRCNLGRAGKGRIEFRIDDGVSRLHDGGRPVLSEAIEEHEADLAEHRVAAVRVGELVLVRLLPYRESVERFYVYSRLTRTMQRVDALERGCRQLPEHQGVVFPGGYVLDGGESRVFLTDASGYVLEAAHRSPNGEDVLYVYRRPDSGSELLCAYNLVRREMAVPVASIGYALFPDGTIVCVRASDEPQRVHTIAIHTSPFCAPEHYAPEVDSSTFLGRIGNAELVLAIGEALALAAEAGTHGAAGTDDINAARFETLVARSNRLLNRFAGWPTPKPRASAGSWSISARPPATCSTSSPPSPPPGVRRSPARCGRAPGDRSRRHRRAGDP